MTSVPNTTHLPKLLVSLGMIPLATPLILNHTHKTHLLPVVLDGQIIGEVDSTKAKDLADKPRTLKYLGREKVHVHLSTCIFMRFVHTAL